MQIKYKPELVSVALSASALVVLIIISDDWIWAIGFAFVMTCFSIILFAINVVIGMVITEDDNNEY